MVPMKPFLILKLIVGIPISYYFAVFFEHYMWHESWEISYKLAPLSVVFLYTALAIRYGVKSGR
jgi:hypothetical protein